MLDPARNTEAMTLEVNPTDKFLSGVHHSFTITSDEGLPQGTVSVGGKDIPSSVASTCSSTSGVLMRSERGHCPQRRSDDG